MQLKDYAPADVNFGKFNYSFSGMGNYINQYDAVVTNPALSSEEKKEKADVGADNLASAIEDMAKKFPRDTAVPKYLYGLVHIYAGIGSDDDSKKAQFYANELATRCPDSNFGSKVREELASGPLAGPASN